MVEEALKLALTEYLRLLAPDPACGLVLSQFLTLYTTPVIYLGFSWLQHRFRRRLATAALAE